MDSLFERRYSAARRLMAQLDIDLLLVNNRENLIYFTGLTDIECLAILIPREAPPCAVTLWLDVEFVRQKTGLDTYGYSFPKGNLAATVIERIKAYGMEQPTIGFERYFVGFSVSDALRQVFPETKFTNASDLFYRIRAIKDSTELHYMRQAGAAVAKGMEAAVRAVERGVTELEVLAEAEYAMLKSGSGGSPFRPQVVSGERTLLTHPCAGEKKIQDGEVVVSHLGATYNGYCAKMCRTVAVGEIGNGKRATYELLVRAQEAAIKALVPGSTTGGIDAAAREVIRAAGLEKYYLDVIGYGVGIRQSEFYPILCRNGTDKIETGMVVDLLLPTIYKPDIGGPRITDCIYVDTTGPELLTDYPRQLIQK